MEAPNLTCSKCRETIGFHRLNIAKVLNTPFPVKKLDEVIEMSAVHPYDVWTTKTPGLFTAAYQCHAHPDHRWTKNLLSNQGVSVAPIGG